MHSFFSEKTFGYATLSLSLALFFVFGVYHLGQFETTDEHFWKYERIGAYWDAVRENKWKKTYINDKPGVSVALISGSGLLFADPDQHRIRDEKMTRGDTLTLYDAGMTESLDTALRLPLLVVNVLLLLFIFSALRHGSGDVFLAALTVTGTALSPIILGISRIINPDALLWSFGAAAVFGYHAFLTTEKKRFLIGAGIALGGALLSKYTGNILFFLLFALLVAHTTFAFGQIVSKEPLSVFLGRHLLSFLALILVSLAVFALFLPAVFVKPILFWRGTFGFWQATGILVPFVISLAALFGDVFLNRTRISTFCLNSLGCILPYVRFVLLLPLIFFGAVFFFGLGDQSLVPLQHLLDTAKGDGTLLFPLLVGDPIALAFLKKLLVEAYPFVFSLPPILLFSVFFLWIRFLIRKESSSLTPIVCVLSLFSVAYFAAALSVDVLANARYSILLYPLFAFLAALGFRELLSLVPASKQGVTRAIGTALLLVSLSLSLFQMKPFYFNYASPFLAQTFSPHDGWGYGLYEAAAYLNALPDKDTLFIWSDRNGICQFLTGPRCISGYRIDTEQTPPNYFVISKRGTERGYVPRDKKTGSILVDYASLETAALWRLDILGRPDNFVLIVPGK